MAPILLQIGIPGAQELVIVVMIFAMLAVPVVAVALLVRYLTGSDSANGERISELEREVEELREERETRDGGGETDD